MGAPPSHEFRVLGPLEVRVGDEALPLGGTRARQRAVLGCLLVQAGETVSTDRLADALWGERPPATAKTVIQGHVLHLRRLLEPARPKGDQGGVLRTHASGYQLVVADGALDSAQFEQLLARGREALAAGRQDRAAGLLREALSLWRGPALGDLAYETWARAEAERLDELRLACLEERIAADLARGLDAELVGEVEALVSEHPLRERFRAQLMLALYRSGRQADALAAFREARRTLVDELGLEPGPELQELNRQVLAHDPGLDREAAGPATNLVLPATPLTGRATELEELGQLMRDGDRRLVTLTGPGGVGKTRLALEIASGVLDSFEDGVWFIDLAPTVDPALVEPAIATTLAAAGPLADRIGDRRVLLVLDNFEQVVEGAAVVADLLGACPRLKILATSRERLRLRAETEYAVDPLPERDAVELFHARAAAVRRDIDAADDDDVAELCRRLDGLPLAIELAAARSKLLPPRDLLARLEQRLALLRGGPRDAPERHRALEATIGWSYDLLDERQRVLLQGLAVFAGGFMPDDAEAVCDADLETLAELLDKSLVTGRAETGRLSLLATVRDFAAQRLEESGSADAVRARHAEYVVTEVEREDDRLTGAEQSAALEAISRRHDDVRAALGWAVERGDGTLGRRLVAAVGWFWFLRSNLAEGRRWVDAALDLPPPAETAVDATASMRAGAIADAQADPAAAARYYGDALAVRRALGDTAGTANALNNLGNVAIRTGDLAAARRSYEESLALARAAGGGLPAGSPLHGLASVELAQGDAAAALPLLEEALALAEAAGDRYGIEVVCEALGAAATELGRTEEAAQHLARGVRLALELDHRFGVAAALDVLAELALETGDAAGASRRLGASEAIRRELGADRGHFEAARAARTERACREALRDRVYEAAFAEGSRLSLEEALALAEREAEATGGSEPGSVVKRAASPRA